MGEWVEVQGPDGAFKAYVARPSGTPKGAVVAIQEIFGVNAVMRGKADWLAREGFLAVCPDLFWRIRPGIDITDKTEAEWKEAFSHFQAFKSETGLLDIQSTIDWARAEVSSRRVGAIGYCLGGLMAYLTACRTNADACVGYYGVGIDQKLDEAVALTKPLMLHIAGEDEYVKPPAQAAIQNGLGGKANVLLHVYAEQDHAFTREGGAHYDAAAAKIADARTLAFLREKLA